MDVPRRPVRLGEDRSDDPLHRSAGLDPLPLSGGYVEDLREIYENVRPPDPYAPLWLANTAKPRACYEMHEITWCTFPDDDPFEGGPTDEAVELAEAGDVIGAHDVLMNTLVRDLRCLDAHAHLGNLEFDRNPKQALVHYEMGMRIGESFLPDGFDGVLLWSSIYNRPYLRCLHGYGLCLWRLGRGDEAIVERLTAERGYPVAGALAVLRDGAPHGAAMLGLGPLRDDWTITLTKLVATPARAPEDWTLRVNSARVLVNTSVYGLPACRVT